MSALLRTLAGGHGHVLAGILNLVLLGGVALVAPDSALATEPQVTGAAAAPASMSNSAVPAPLFAAWYEQILGDRTRMIQVGTIFMIVGILFLCWTRGK